MMNKGHIYKDKGISNGSLHSILSEDLVLQSLYKISTEVSNDVAETTLSERFCRNC